jgi:rhodanese-related sulfurtransferase
MLMGLKSISPQELHESMRNSTLTIFDLNTQQSWQRARVRGAINLAVDFDAAALPQDMNTSLVFYCANPLCLKAPRAAKRAGKLGYSNIRVMAAGITGWTDARLPVEEGT